jgi:hypothetical protein
MAPGAPGSFQDGHIMAALHQLVSTAQAADAAARDDDPLPWSGPFGLGCNQLRGQEAARYRCPGTPQDLTPG